MEPSSPDNIAKSSEPTNKTAARLNSLNIGARNQKLGRKYTTFVKLMRYALPLIALGLTVVLATWPEMDDKIIIMQKDDLIPNASTDMGENELLNPKYQSTDAQGQPILVNATRALQNQENPNLIRLEKPIADIKMKNGSTVNIAAKDGTYEQENEKLFLHNDVKIDHESGYTLTGEELRMDMKTREAFSDKDVTIKGPDATIKAKGLSGNMDDGLLIFNGPATLTIHKNTEPKIDNETSGETNE